MSDNDKPKIVYTIPYYDYLKFERWKFYFWVLVAVSITSNIFFANFAVVMTLVPKPILNQLMGITPEKAKNIARNEAISERYERFMKQEKIRQETIAKDRQQKYFAESAEKNRIEYNKIINNPVVSEETARLRAFR